MVHNFRPTDKVLDHDILRMHDAWATRTAPGQPTLRPDTHTERVTLWAFSHNQRQLRRLEDFLIDRDYRIESRVYNTKSSWSHRQYITFDVSENALYPIAQHLAKWPTVYRVDLTTDYGPGNPLNRPDSCAHRFVNAIRKAPNIKNPDDIPPDFVDKIDDNYYQPCYPAMAWNPSLQPTIDDCVIDNPVLNIHRREFYHRLLESYDGADPIVRDDAGNMLIPTLGTYVSNCVMYNAAEGQWYSVRQKWTNPH